MTNQILIAMTTPKKHPFKRLADFFFATAIALLGGVVLDCALLCLGWFAHMLWWCFQLGWRAF